MRLRLPLAKVQGVTPCPAGGGSMLVVFVF